MKTKIDNYFRSVKNPLSERRRFKGKSIAIVLGALVVVAIIWILVAGGEAEKKILKRAEAHAASHDETPREPDPKPYFDNPHLKDSGRDAPHGKPSRNYGAPQLVTATSSGGLQGEKLPMGTTVPGRLMNSVISSDHASPVIALISDEVYFGNTSFIPSETKAIGQASLDEASKRMQVRFHTLVFPNGQQANFSGLALQNDGSSGIPGNYHSGQLSSQVGRFTGHFVGGVASGLKDREAGGLIAPLEPGSLKNGILNGLALSATDQGKAYADEMKDVHPYLEVPSGATFIIYFEQSWSKPL